MNWTKLHSRIYARGYFINYVKFLGLAVDPMVNLFNQQYDYQQDAPSLMSHHVATEKTLPIVPIVVSVLLVLVAIFAYLQWQNTNTDELVSEPEALIAEPTASAEDTATAETNNATDAVTTTEQTALPSETQTAVNADAEQEWDALNALEQAQTEPSSNQAADAGEKLELSFTDSCWVEIKDGEQNLLVSRILKAGQKLSLTSTSGFSIHLGNANVATLTFNQQKVDLAPYTKSSVARLTLGMES
jgi:cytoskeleton protein RodZ